MSWLSLGSEFNPIKRLNPIRPVLQWYNAYYMDTYLDSELDKHFLPVQARNDSEKIRSSQNRSIIGLAAGSYMAEKESKGADKVDETAFREFTKTQIRTFLFAGHDTTSSTMCYIYYLWWKNPEVLNRVRAEHDVVFGPDITNTASLLTEKPSLINQVPYTTAVIKEVLRIFPPSSSMRQGASNCSIIGANGTKYPTDGVLVWVLHQALHRNQSCWVKPDEFLPER